MPAGIPRAAYRLRLRGVWLFVLPFLWTARPTGVTLLVGAVGAAAGLWLRAWAARHLRKTVRLTVSGPYAHVRNPLFLGSFLIGLGVVAAGGRLLWFPVLVGWFALVYPWHAAREERTLEAAHGEAYRRYRAAVPALLPRLSPYRDPLGAGPAPPVPPPAGPRPPNRRGRPPPPPFESYPAPSWALYLRHREWEALLGTVAAFLALLVRGGLPWG